MTLTIITILAGFLAFLSGTMGLSLYFVMRKGGLAETIIERREGGSDILQKKVENLRSSLNDLISANKIFVTEVDHKVKLMEARVTGFETKYAKQSKKEERAELQRQILEAAENGQQIFEPS